MMIIVHTAREECNAVRYVCKPTQAIICNQKWHGQDVWHDDNGWQKKPSEKDILIIITLFLLFIIYVSPICVFSIPERIFGSRTCRGGLSPKVIRSLQGESLSLAWSLSHIFSICRLALLLLFSSSLLRVNRQNRSFDDCHLICSNTTFFCAFRAFDYTNNNILQTITIQNDKRWVHFPTKK